MFQKIPIVKEEGHDEAELCNGDADLGSTDEHWFEEFDSEFVAETELKSESDHSCADIEDSTFQIDSELTSTHAFAAETTNSDDGIENSDEKREDLEGANARSEKLYTCEICSKIFKRKYNWQQHKLVHTDEKNFKCHVCCQVYKSENNLK